MDVNGIIGITIVLSRFITGDFIFAAIVAAIMYGTYMFSKQAKKKEEIILKKQRENNIKKINEYKQKHGVPRNFKAIQYISGIEDFDRNNRQSSLYNKQEYYMWKDNKEIIILSKPSEDTGEVSVFNNIRLNIDNIIYYRKRHEEHITTEIIYEREGKQFSIILSSVAYGYLMTLIPQKEHQVIEQKILKEEQERLRQEEERRLKEEQERLRQEEEKRLKEEQERLRQQEQLEKILKLDLENNGHIYFVLWIHKIRIIKKLQNILEQEKVIITDKSIYSTFLEIYRLSLETRNLSEFKEVLSNEGSRIINQQLERNLGENCFNYNESNLNYENISSWRETEATLISKIINTISQMVLIIVLYREKENILENKEFYSLMKKMQKEKLDIKEDNYNFYALERVDKKLYEMYNNFYSNMLSDKYTITAFTTLIDIILCSESIINDSEIKLLLENKLDTINYENIITQIAEEIGRFNDDYLDVFGQIYEFNNDFDTDYDYSIIESLYMLEISRRVSKSNITEIFHSLLKVRQISKEIEVVLQRKKLELEKHNYLNSELEDEELEDEELEDEELEDESYDINEPNELRLINQEQYLKIEKALKEDFEKNAALYFILWTNSIYDINQIRDYLEKQYKHFVSDESLYNTFLDVYKLSLETLNLSNFIEELLDEAERIICTKLGELYFSHLKQIFDKITQMVGIIILYREKENIINNEEFYNLMKNMQSSLGLYNSREKLYDMYINFYSNILNDSYSEQNFSVLINIIFCAKTFDDDLKVQRLLENKLQSFNYEEIVKIISEEVEYDKVYSDSVLNNLEIDGKPRKIEETLYMLHVTGVHSIATLKEIFSLLLKVSNISDDVEVYLKRKRLEADRQRYLMNDFTKEKEMELELLNLSNVSSGIEFEKYLEMLFKKLGYTVETTKVSGDQGADLIVIKDKTKTVVQAKFYSSKVGNKAVQEVVAAIRYYDADFGMVVTNNYYTDSAIELADANNITLIDGDMLNQWIFDLKSNI